MRLSSRFSAWVLLALAMPVLGTAADKAGKAAGKSAGAADPNQAGEMLEVEKVKEKYWAQGQDSKMGVVQNRLYSKEKKFALGLLGGTSIADPFLSIKNVGGSLGYHFSEYLGVAIVGWKNIVGPSSALKTAKDEGKDFNTVEPRWYLGVEGMGSIMYGKLSLLGAKIIYYDMHVILGVGMTKHEHYSVDTTVVPRELSAHDRLTAAAVWGLGQRFYISQPLSIRLDYRNEIYGEVIQEKVNTAKLGDEMGRRTVFAHTINIGIDYMFSLF